MSSSLASPSSPAAILLRILPSHPLSSARRCLSSRETLTATTNIVVAMAADPPRPTPVPSLSATQNPSHPLARTLSGYPDSSANGSDSLGLRDAAAGKEPGEPVKIRTNRVLKTCGSSGGLYGNMVRVIRLMYTGLESSMVVVRDCNDWINSVIAGLGTGALFHATNGPRSAAVAGALSGILAGAAMVGKQLAK